MDLNQFSAQFDVLADSYRRFKDFDRKDAIDSLDFNEFDKSCFLTDAQEDLIRAVSYTHLTLPTILRV